MTRPHSFTSHSPARTFLLGGLAGALLLSAGLVLGGAQRGQRGNAQPDASFDRLSVRHLDIVDRRGRVVLLIFHRHLH